MTKAARAFLLLAVVAPSLALAADTQPATEPTTAPDPGVTGPAPEDLAKAIAEGITLLEAGKNKEFLELYANPYDLKQMKRGGGFDKAVARFAERKAPDVLAGLKRAQTLNPTLKDIGNGKTVATYPKAEKAQRALELIRFEGRWYIN